MARLKEAAERAKIELSNVITTDIDLPFVASDSTGAKNLHYTLTRARLEELSRPIVEKIEAPIKRVVQDAKLEIKDIQKVILIGGMTRMPLVRKTVEEIMGKSAERGVDPMEAVAIGAAIQGGVLAGEVKDILLLDVTPLSLGVETLGGIMTKVVEKNTTIPTKRTQVFSTAADFQTAVTIHVLQGERAMAADNISLGMFNLAGIPPAPRGVPQVEVTFEIDASGILNVSAKDLGTGKESKITISASTKLSKESKEKMVRDAEQYADQDKKKMEEAQLLNEADSMLYTAEKTKTDLTGKISEGDVGKIDAASRDLRKAIEAKDFAEIKAKWTRSGRSCKKWAVRSTSRPPETQDSQGPQAGGAPPGGAKGPSGDGNVTDAEYKVVDEEKK